MCPCQGSIDMGSSLHRLCLCLILGVFFLAAMNYFPENLSPVIHEKFYLDYESNIPTWYSTVLLFLVSIVSLLIYILRHKTMYHDRWPVFWFAFSLTYIFLSMDEAGKIHELSDTVLHMKWLKLYAPFAGLFFLLTTYYLIRINWERITTIMIVGGLIIYALGGWGAEAVDTVELISSSFFKDLEPVVKNVWRCSEQ
jgi:hypothetical protein